MSETASLYPSGRTDPLNVLHVLPQSFTRGKTGGGERYTVELIKALQAAGVSPVVLHTPSLLRQAKPGGGTRWMSPSEYRRILRHVDLVHVHQLNSPAMDNVMLLSGRLRKPVVVSDYGGGWRTPGRALGERRRRFINAFAAISPASLRELDPYAELPKSKVIWGGGDHVLRSERASGNERPADKYDVLYTGRILPHKGLHVLVDALPHGVSLAIAGEARDADYLAHVRRLASGKNVDFLGRVDDDNLADLYARARVTVMPSVGEYQGQTYARPELLGLVALESVCAGTPVIGSDLGGLRDALVELGQTVVPAGSSADLRDAIKNALAEQDRKPEKTFTWASTAARTLAVYDEVLRES